VIVAVTVASAVTVDLTVAVVVAVAVVVTVAAAPGLVVPVPQLTSDVVVTAIASAIVSKRTLGRLPSTWPRLEQKRKPVAGTDQCRARAGAIIDRLYFAIVEAINDNGSPARGLSWLRRDVLTRIVVTFDLDLGCREASPELPDTGLYRLTPPLGAEDHDHGLGDRPGVALLQTGGPLRRTVTATSSPSSARLRAPTIRTLP
jgi:hypothetical protein